MKIIQKTQKNTKDDDYVTRQSYLQNWIAITVKLI